MKTVILFLTVVLMIAHSAMAQTAGCAEVVQSLRDIAANIAGDADLYFGHRKKFVDATFRRATDVSVLAKAARDAEKKNAVAAGDNLKQRMPNLLAKFQAALEMARSQKCLSAAELRAIEEKTTDFARNVNFDQFPQEEMEGGK